MAEAAHSIRGGAGAIGASAVAELAGRLEGAAKVRPLEELGAYVDELIRAVTAAEGDLRAVVDNLDRQD